MGHQQQRHVSGGAGRADQIKNGLLVGQVDVGRWFVGQQQRRLVGQGAGHGHTLLFADGELSGTVVQAVGESDAFEQLQSTVAVGPAPREAHSQQHVFECGEGGKQVECLVDEPDPFGPKAITDLFGHSRDLGVVDHHASGIRSGDAGDDIQQRGLAPATGSDQGHLLAGPEFEPFDLQYRQAATVRLSVALADVL